MKKINGLLEKKIRSTWIKSQKLFCKNKEFAKGYKQYSLDFTPLSKPALIGFLKRQAVTEFDLIVVPQVFKKIIGKRFKGEVICTLDSIDSYGLESFDRLIWATERVERRMQIARTFYGLKKPVIVMRNTGPATVWMHDEIKERVLKDEYAIQRIEGIEKFEHGVGADFGNLLQIIDNAKNVEGDFVEIGCFMGSSTCVMASYIEQNKIDKRFFVYDYFDGFTYDEAKLSIDATWAGTHKTDGRDAVERRVRKRMSVFSKNVSILERNILHVDALKEVKKISFANIDVDLYEAVYAALNHVHEKLSTNGIIVVEDAGHTPWLLGAKLALEEFLDEVGENIYVKLQMESGQYILIKK